MAIKKRGKSAVVSEPVKKEEFPVSEEAVAEENPHINADEAEALAKQVEAEEAEAKQISIKKMESVVKCVQDKFNLAEGNYVVNAFADKGNKSQISLSNEDFDIVVLIKDNEKFGIV